MKLIILSLALLTLASCAGVQTRNGMGLIYSEVKDAIEVTEHVRMDKKGEACATNILGLISTGDMSVAAAKEAGKIQKIATVDFSQFSILGLFAKTCTIVQGE